MWDMRIICNDLVKVISGSHKGKSGLVKQVDFRNQRVKVDGITALRHKKGKDKGEVVRVDVWMRCCKVKVIKKYLAEKKK